MKQYKSALIKLFHSWTHSDAQKPDYFNLEQGLQRSFLVKKPIDGSVFYFMDKGHC